MRRPALAAALALWAAVAAAAETRLSPLDFDTLSSGKTLFFKQNGIPYGAEQYLPDRQVIWQYGDGSCTRGTWYIQGEAMCFVYEDAPVPQCWIMAERPAGVFVRRAGTEPGHGSEIRLDRETTAPLVCAGPDLGV
ncbi:MAG: hypothetical protein AAGE76_14555 [Pseudomonadota bacterium]